MSVATINLAAVPLTHEHLHSGCQLSNSASSSSTTATNKYMHSTPPHPHAHGYHRRRLASPISPLSMTYNTHSLHKTKEEVLSACDREVQWSFEQEYGRTLEKHMKISEVIPLYVILSDILLQDRYVPSAEMMDLQPELEWYMLHFL